MTLPLIGEAAPTFSLTNQHGQTISLKDYKNTANVVLYFYPKALTPGCTTQACSIRDHKQQFADLDTVVFGVSTDPIPKLVKFTEKKELNFDLLSDEDHHVAESYGVWGPKKFMGREFLGTKRVTFIIGKDGKLKHIIEKVNTKTHHDEVLEYIKANL